MANKDYNLGFVFDLDGTLINSTEIQKKIEKEIIDTFNIQSYDDMQEEIDNLIFRIMEKENRKNLRRDIMWAIFKKLGLSFRQRMKALLIASNIFKIEIKKVKLFDGTKEMLEFLDSKSSQYAIATTSSRKEVDDRLKKRFPDFYEKLSGKIITRDDVKNLKPAPDQIKKASEIMKIPLNRLIMVGDMHSDIKMGKAVDAITVGVLTGVFSNERMLEYKPNFILNSVSEIPKIYDEINELVKYKITQL